MNVKGLSELESFNGRLIKDLFNNTLVLCFNVNDIVIRKLLILYLLFSFLLKCTINNYFLM
jgi:hypothetical protein